jgi:hypothetical protein
MTMKKIFIFLAFLFPEIIAVAQQPDFPGDTIGIWTVINFEESSPYIHINPSAQNIWQIGKPQKTFFNAAYSVPNAILTDTMNFYPDNNLSTFDLYIGGFNMNGQTYGAYPLDIFVDMRHKYDTDSLTDGGFITVSWDKGETFQNIIFDTVYVGGVGGVSPMWGTGTNLYTSENFLFTGESGFSGNSGGWVHTSFSWIVPPVKQAMDFPPDTMILRFNFISDGNNTNKEGWMIDQIRLFSIDLGSGIRENPGKDVRSLIVTNPVKSTATIKLDKIYNEVEYSLTDMTGRICSEGSKGTCKDFVIDRNNLSPGFYLLKIILDHQYTEVKRVIISE